MSSIFFVESAISVLTASLFLPSASGASANLDMLGIVTGGIKLGFELQ
jgi:hypothetical protein